MTAFINQYKQIFLISWITLFLIFPAWALPISVTARATVFFGLIIYFSISAYMMSRWFHGLTVDKPIIVKTRSFAELLKNNKFLVAVCSVAVILHIRPLFLPILIIGDEALHLNSGLWIYEYIESSWHSIFQIVFWVLICLLVFLTGNKSLKNYIVNKLKCLSGETSNKLTGFIFVFSILLFFVSYFLLLRNIHYFPSLIRYPPLIKFFYQIVYSAFGITHVGPRALQVVFYILGAVYLYRTIILFSNKESAIIGASIYLFFPVLFAYANLAEVGCGTLFFVILISFHFLRFIKQGDNRDLLLTSFFIGTGFFYKRIIFLMFFICIVYLIVSRIKSKDFNFTIHLKVMLISLVSIIPWMIIGKFFSWRNYKIVWSNFTPFDGKVFTFFSHFPIDVSWVIFFLFLLSVVYALVAKRNTLSFYFGFLFIAFYFFLVLDIGNYSPRLYMVLYPAIAVLLSQFLYGIIEKIKWKHSFKIIYLVLSVYLISICTVPSINAQFISSNEFVKLKYFPTDKAMQWVKENIKEGEKILTLRIMSSPFYIDKYGIDRNKIVGFLYDLSEVATSEKLKTFYKENKISYIMFPSYSMEIPVLDYLNEKREKEFVEVASFNIDNNYIYIYRLN